MSGALPKRLDGFGRCCGRKPHPYKRPVPHAICLRCGAAFHPETRKQIPNLAFTEIDGLFYRLIPGTSKPMTNQCEHCRKGIEVVQNSDGVPYHKFDDGSTHACIPLWAKKENWPVLEIPS